jgi:cytoskeletal protein RodZ
MQQDNLLYIEIGKQLRNKREEMAISINSASSALKIRNVYLTAIENGELEKLPAGLYRDGYIKSYADFLGIHLDLEKGEDCFMNSINLGAANRNIRPQLLQPSRLIVIISVLALVLINMALYLMK